MGRSLDALLGDGRYVCFYSEGYRHLFALEKGTGAVYCQDGVEYKPGEVKLLGRGGWSLRVHAVKRIFGGEVVKGPSVAGELGVDGGLW